MCVSVDLLQRSNSCILLNRRNRREQGKTGADLLIQSNEAMASQWKGGLINHLYLLEKNLVETVDQAVPLRCFPALRFRHPLTAPISFLFHRFVVSTPNNWNPAIKRIFVARKKMPKLSNPSLYVCICVCIFFIYCTYV